MKVCGKCKVARPYTEFHRNKNNVDGFSRYCRGCANERLRKWRADFEFTSQEFYRKLKIQNYRCWICQLKKPLVVDHNHKTKKVRGLLCNDCNLALGFFKDNLEYLSKAALYLERFDD